MATTWLGWRGCDCYTLATGGRQRDTIVYASEDSFLVPRQLLVATLAIGLTCGLFAFLASSAALAVMLKNGIVEEDGFYLRLTIKCVFFLAVTLGSAALLVRYRPKAPHSPSRPTVAPISLPIQAVALALVAAFTLPNLGDYPSAAPDELHHLIVARNLSAYNAYASGHPDSGFHYLDEYDSIGVVGIAWITSVFDILGVSLVAARIAMAITAFLLIAAMLRLFNGHVTGRTALLAVVLALSAFGTVYLSRTVYGEVPAFAFLMGGLCFWQATRFPKASALAAGTLFALAVFIKTFILLAAAPMAVVFFYDRLTQRRVVIGRVVFAAVGFCAVYGAIAVVMTLLAHRLEVPRTSQLLYYRHYLLMGFDGVPTGLRWLADRPAMFLVSVVTMVWAGLALTARRYEPEYLVLYLSAVLFLFWWLFATPGTIPRYLWYFFFVAALLTALLLEDLLARWRSDRRLWVRGIIAGFVVAVLLAHGQTAHEVIERILQADQMDGDHALIAYLDTVDDDVPVRTTWWPVERVANFFLTRDVPVVDAITPESPPGLYIYERTYQPEFSVYGEAVATPGPYGVLRIPPHIREFDAP